MNFFKRILVVLGPRVIGSVIGGIATFVAAKTQDVVQIDPAHAAAAVTAILLSYAGGHRATSALTNPGDSATARVSEAVKEAADLGTTVRVAPKIN